MSDKRALAGTLALNMTILALAPVRDLSTFAVALAASFALYYTLRGTWHP